jgi:hypothetical protein
MLSTNKALKPYSKSINYTCWKFGLILIITTMELRINNNNKLIYLIIILIFMLPLNFGIDKYRIKN